MFTREQMSNKVALSYFSRIFFILFVISIFPLSSFGSDSLVAPDTVSSKPKADAIATTMRVIVGAYQKLLTDIETHNCPMKPSCSAFAVEVIKKTNPFKAILLISDRLIRDNGFARRYYRTDKDGKLLDPSQRYLDCEKERR